MAQLSPPKLTAAARRATAAGIISARVDSGPSVPVKAESLSADALVASKKRGRHAAPTPSTPAEQAAKKDKTDKRKILKAARYLAGKKLTDSCGPPTASHQEGGAKGCRGVWQRQLDRAAESPGEWSGAGIAASAHSCSSLPVSTWLASSVRAEIPGSHGSAPVPDGRQDHKDHEAPCTALVVKEEPEDPAVDSAARTATCAVAGLLVSSTPPSANS